MTKIIQNWSCRSYSTPFSELQCQIRHEKRKGFLVLQSNNRWRLGFVKDSSVHGSLMDDLRFQEKMAFSFWFYRSKYCTEDTLIRVVFLSLLLVRQFNCRCLSLYFASPAPDGSLVQLIFLIRDGSHVGVVSILLHSTPHLPGTPSKN